MLLLFVDIREPMFVFVSNKRVVDLKSYPDSISVIFLARLFLVYLTLILPSCAVAGMNSADVDALEKQGLADSKQGLYATAEPLFRRVLAAKDASFGADQAAVAQCAYNLGWALKHEGRYDEAEPLLRRSLAIVEGRLGLDSPVVATHLTELGSIYAHQGRYHDADNLYLRALAIRRKALGPDDPLVAATLDDLGYVDTLTGHFPEAEERYKDALRIEERRLGPDDPATAFDLGNLGFTLTAAGRYGEAEPNLKRAVAIREKALGSNHPLFADSLNDLGELYGKQKRFAESERLLKRAQSIWRESLGPDHPDVATKSLKNFVELYKDQGNLPAAIDASTSAVELLERHLLQRASQRWADGGAEQRTYRRLFLQNIALLHASGSRDFNSGDVVARSFEVGQFASASTTGQAVASMAARFASGTDALAATIRQLQDLLDERQRLDEMILAATSQPAAERDAAREAGIRRSIDDTETKIDALERRIDSEFPNYSRLVSPNPISVVTVQSLLGPHEVLLVYLVDDDASWLWAVRRDRSALFRLAITRTALTAGVTALRQSLDPWQNPTKQPFPASRAFSLHQAILAPAGSFLQDAKQVLVVPDGPLQSLPLGVLVTRAPKSDPVDFAGHRDIAWFARDHAITVLPTVGSLQVLRVLAPRSKASLPFLGIGAPVLHDSDAAARSAPPDAPLRVAQSSLFRSGTVDVNALRELPSLPETAFELTAIARDLGASDANLYLGRRASEPVIRSIPVERYRIIEFATHGLMSGDLGLGEPSLVLTPPDIPTPDNDGLLTASKIATMKFDADWVVLSACNTAAGDGTPDGGGLSGLAKAFFHAGARSLLVSHWSVNSGATVMLTTGAFAALARDPSIGRAEALRRSMMELMAPSSPPEFSHPMFWAPFSLAGEGGGQAATDNAQP